MNNMILKNRVFKFCEGIACKSNKFIEYRLTVNDFSLSHDIIMILW